MIQTKDKTNNIIRKIDKLMWKKNYLDIGDIEFEFISFWEEEGEEEEWDESWLER